MESSKRRGVRLGRKPGLDTKAEHKAILAERYYRDNNLPIAEIMKLLDSRSKRTLYKYLAYRGRRNCNVVFWDRGQELYEAYCPEHLKSSGQKNLEKCNLRMIKISGKLNIFYAELLLMR
jgi:hypothetical protein